MKKKNNQTKFHNDLKKYMDEFVNFIYDVTEKFPKQHLYGLTSQIQRASLSIILNYIEGYARLTKGYLKNFLEISYGSLKETKYLLYFSYKRGYLKKEDYEKGLLMADKIGKMLWGILIKL
jgi:four helix bundle protein